MLPTQNLHVKETSRLLTPNALKAELPMVEASNRTVVESRRRVIVSRVDPGMARRHNIDFLRIPFLLFADETVEDTDEMLGPILAEIMRDAAAGYGMMRR